MKKMNMFTMVLSGVVVTGAVASIVGQKASKQEEVKRLASNAIMYTSSNINLILKNLNEIIKIRKLDDDGLLEVNILSAINKIDDDVDSTIMLKELVVLCASPAITADNALDESNSVISKFLK